MVAGWCKIQDLKIVHNESKHVFQVKIFVKKENNRVLAVRPCPKLLLILSPAAFAYESLPGKPSACSSLCAGI